MDGLDRGGGRIDGGRVVSHLEEAGGEPSSFFYRDTRATRLRELCPSLYTISDNGGERQEPQGRGGDPRVHHQPPQASSWLVISRLRSNSFFGFIPETLISSWLS